MVHPYPFLKLTVSHLLKEIPFRPEWESDIKVKES
jgi:hypothetical protein